MREEDGVGEEDDSALFGDFEGVHFLVEGFLTTEDAEKAELGWGTGVDQF